MHARVGCQRHMDGSYDSFSGPHVRLAEMFSNLTSEMTRLSGDDDCMPRDRPTTRTRNENRVYVRKYYQSHRDQIMLRKTAHACRLHGRVPRVQTVVEHAMSLRVLITAFREWAAAREPDDRQRIKRVARFRGMLIQLNQQSSDSKA